MGGVGARMALAAGLALVVLVAGCGHSRPVGAERVKSLIGWPKDCASVQVERPLKDRTLPLLEHNAQETAAISCEMLGPNVEYLRFESRSRMAGALAVSDLPAGLICETATEIVLDNLDNPPAFRRMCHGLGGRLTRGPVISPATQRAIRRRLAKARTRAAR